MYEFSYLLEKVEKLAYLAFLESLGGARGVVLHFWAFWFIQTLFRVMKSISVWNLETIGWIPGFSGSADFEVFWGVLSKTGCISFFFLFLMWWRICWTISIYKNSIIGEIMTPFQGVKVGVVKKWLFWFLLLGWGNFNFWSLALLPKLGMLILYKIW